MSGNSEYIHIGYALVRIQEVGTPAIPATETAWNAIPEAGYTDPEVGSVFKPQQEIKKINVARYPVAVKAIRTKGAPTLELSFMESDITKVAQMLGGATADVADNAIDGIKTFKGPKPPGLVQEFNIQVEQKQDDGTLLDTIRVPRGFVDGQPEVVTKEDQSRTLKVTFGMLTVETAGDWIGMAFEVGEQYTVV